MARKRSYFTLLIQDGTPGDRAWEPASQTIEAVTCDRLGANIYGRATAFLTLAERRDDKGARRELKALLKFFPKEKAK